MNEEIVARFGADTAPMDRALRNVNQSLRNTGEEGEKSFLKMGHAGKEFKNLIGQLSDLVPGVGAAFRLITSPIVGTLALAATAATFLKTQIDKINQSSDAKEKGMADPVFKMRDALRDAKTSLQDFDRAMENFRRGQEKGPVEKLTESLKEQLSLLDRQVAAAEKLSAKDKERLEHQKLLVTHGLQGRAMFALNAQKTAAQTELDAATAAERALLGKTTIASAKGAILGGEASIAALQTKNPQLSAGESMGLATAVPPVPGLFNAVKNFLVPQEDAESVARRIRSIQANIDRAKDVIQREEQARKAAADRVAHAQARLGAANSGFDSMSMAIEQTRQAIVTSGGFGAGVPADSPNQRVLNYLENSRAGMHNWYKAHGIPDLMGFVSPRPAQQDPAGNAIDQLNKMFQDLRTPDGLKVTMVVEDN